MFLRAIRQNSTRTRLKISDVLQPVHPLLLQRALSLQNEFVELEKKMALGAFDQATAIQFSSVLAILDNYHSYQRDYEELASLVDLLNDESDSELLLEAQSELSEVAPKVAAATLLLQKRLLPSVKHDLKPALFELRPGVGGSEAALFTKDLFNLYINYATMKRWPFEIISENRLPNGGINEAVFSIDYPGAYNLLRHESGVHRVQRIPATETKGRIHTSTSAVVVLPKMSDGTELSLKEDERLFEPGEIRIDTMRSGGKGGQHVNTTDSAVRIVHIPTGITVVQQDERSQPKNKAKAFSILRSRLAQLEREKEVAEQRKLRTDQVTTTDRSDKIRTYNYPQNRVTDHRCGYLIHDLTGFMAGQKLDEMIETLEEHEFEERLAHLVAESGP